MNHPKTFRLGQRTEDVGPVIFRTSGHALTPVPATITRGDTVYEVFYGETSQRYYARTPMGAYYRAFPVY